MNWVFIAAVFDVEKISLHPLSWATFSIELPFVLSTAVMHFVIECLWTAKIRRVWRYQRGITESVNRRTDNSTQYSKEKGQTTIYRTYI